VLLCPSVDALGSKQPEIRAIQCNITKPCIQGDTRLSKIEYLIFIQKNNNKKQPLWYRVLKKMKTTLFVRSKLTLHRKFKIFEFGSIGGYNISKKLLSSTYSYRIHCGKFKHLKYSLNVNFEETNSVILILVPHWK